MTPFFPKTGACSLANAMTPFFPKPGAGSLAALILCHCHSVSVCLALYLSSCLFFCLSDILLTY